MVCSRLGATQVILTDHDEQSLTHMRQDCETNQVLANVCKLDWFNPPSSTSSSSSFFNSFNININNNNNNKNDDNDNIEELEELELVLVAGDVLYKHALIEPFFSTVDILFDQYLSINKIQTNPILPKLLLCHVPRAGVEHVEILASAKTHGLKVQEIGLQEWQKGNLLQSDFVPLDDTNRAKVYMMQRF